ncbi:la-related protein 1C-like isoform X1 [Cynara cardunculus var. scolymus]|uniref:la-related protein 1C-like isoform X1 n=1 Tax=Cynara cardunculus var. scolymus TaxID=59895 RepID=UPI000D628334|nr:la-related protein 1C-like isoform X1 [Cynara cardunculus var. scolymus]
MAAMNFQSDDSGGGVIKSPRSPGHSQTVSSPWSSIVQGSPVIVSDAVSAAPVSVAPAPTFSSSVEEQIGNFTSDWCPPTTVPEIASSPDDSGTDGQGSDSGGVGSSSASKKPVWNKPNGVVEVVSPVMGAVSWPALGESTKASPKSSSSDSLKALADGPLPPALQVVTGNSSPSSHKQASDSNLHPTSTPNHVAPARQRSMKRGGSFNSNLSVNGGATHMSSTSHDLVVESPHNTSLKPGTAAAESSPRDQTHIESQRGGFGAQSHNGNDHQHQRHSYRRGSGGQHTRVDGSYHHNYGGKRDQDRGNHEWNQHSRSFNSRDTHLQPQRGYPRGGYIRPSVHASTPFIPPPMPLPVRSFGNNMIYPDMPSPLFYVQGPPPPPESLRGMPLVAPIPPPMYFAVPDPMLHARIVSQIDYYFSNENLVKDTYLRKNMDEHGWVPVSLIAGFKKVLYLTDNVQLILDAMGASTIVEVQGDKIRRRNDWMRWLMHPPAQYSNLSSPQAVGRSPNQDVLASQLQGVTLDETASTNQDSVDTFFGRSSSGEFQLQQAGGEEIGHVGGQQQAGPERATLA